MSKAGRRRCCDLLGHPAIQCAKDRRRVPSSREESAGDKGVSVHDDDGSPGSWVTNYGENIPISLRERMKKIYFTSFSCIVSMIE
jgi:hypothetical protein